MQGQNSTVARSATSLPPNLRSSAFSSAAALKVYAADFSSDPHWETSSVSRFFWRSQERVFQVNRISVNGGGNYAYHDVRTDMSNRSFRLEGDVLSQSVDYGCDVRFGLYPTGA